MNNETYKKASMILTGMANLAVLGVVPWLYSLFCGFI